MTDLLLALDNGTQSVRALAFDLRGNLVGRSQVKITPYTSPQPGWAEQSADYFWESLCQACQGLWASGIDPARIAGVSITSQRGTVINLDKTGMPLRPAIVWLDQRTTPNLPPVGGLWGLIFRLIRMRETIAYIQAEAEFNWLYRNQPDIVDKTHKYLLLSGYHTYKLTGRYADSIGCMVGYLPFDFKKHGWCAPNDWKWTAMPIDAAQLPEVLPPGAELGRVTAEAAAQTGLRPGTPVIAAGSDKACEVLGSGCLTPEIACLGYGTTATIVMHSEKYVEVTPFIPPYPAAVPGAFNLETQVFRGYWMVSWFKQQFGHREEQIAAEKQIAAEELFDALLGESPAGAMGLMLQPYWTPGIKRPGREAKGAVIGFGEMHTRAHVYRAIVEGVAYALREGKDRAEARGKVAVKGLRVCGGGSQSDAVMQITADVFGLPAERPHTFEASGLGAAMDAAVGLGLHRDFPTAVEEMTRISRVFEPDAARAETYDALYQRVYLPMYGRLKPLYQAIRAITNYPPMLD
ncbi:MAG TPA: FGGY-family carbohydrate kinase [Aggregatilineales bacterium]|nr:carbohydrate kinase [Anaerolineales bacterium]HRE46868.1 FGGY-family carbohydrate kinase [Aggregatilineales bacterium]